MPPLSGSQAGSAAAPLTVLIAAAAAIAATGNASHNRFMRLLSIINRAFLSSQRRPDSGNNGNASMPSHIDPVCRMTIEEADAVGSHTHGGVTYYFCNESCLERFRASPAEFLTPTAERTPDAAPPGTEYTCPMHPEIVQIGPGVCPLCGMALEPRIASANDGPNPELVDMQRRFAIAALLGAPVFLVTMA